MPTTISGSTGVTFPAGGVGNPAGAVVGTTDTQTMTNKTLTTPNIDSAQFATVSGTAPIYGCRAWVNFNGTGTIGTNQTIRASGNVTSVFKNATGDYTVTFTTAMPDANYANSLSVQVAAATFFRSAYVTDTGKAAGSLRFVTVNGSNVNADFPGVDVAVFR